jgi:hypothetical protein
MPDDLIFAGMMPSGIVVIFIVKLRHINWQ